MYKREEKLHIQIIHQTSEQLQQSNFTIRKENIFKSHDRNTYQLLAEKELLHLKQL